MKHILIVEDSEADRFLLHEAFSSVDDKTNLHMVSDGLGALRFLNREEEFAGAPRPDMVILDLNLPKMHGFEVLSKMKDKEDLKCIPVTILSSSKSSSDICTSYRMNASCYLTKPSRYAELVDMIKSLYDFWSYRVTYCPGNR